MKDRQTLNLLWDLAKEREPVAAARVVAGLYFKNELVSVGFNRRKTHPLQKEFGKNDNSIYLHAEIDAIIQARKYLSESEFSKVSLFIARRKFEENKKNEVWGLAKPCPGCMRAIRYFKINRVIHTCDPDYSSGKYTYGIIEKGRHK